MRAHIGLNERGPIIGEARSATNCAEKIVSIPDALHEGTSALGGRDDYGMRRKLDAIEKLIDVAPISCRALCEVCFFDDERFRHHDAPSSIKEGKDLHAAGYEIEVRMRSIGPLAAQSEGNVGGVRGAPCFFESGIRHCAFAWRLASEGAHAVRIDVASKDNLRSQMCGESG